MSSEGKNFYATLLTLSLDFHLLNITFSKLSTQTRKSFG